MASNGPSSAQLYDRKLNIAGGRSRLPVTHRGFPQLNTSNPLPKPIPGIRERINYRITQVWHMLEVITAIIGTGLLGVSGWAVHMHSRVSVLEADRATIRELVDIRLVDITRRLNRIEEKLDDREQRDDIRDRQ